MSAHLYRPYRPRRRRRLDALQRVSAVVLTLGLVALAFAMFGTPANADGTDQITGLGASASAVTVKWSDGLLGADNQTVITPRSPTEAGPQMDPTFYQGTSAEFKNIQVTVSQTQDLVHQAVGITWGGATPTLPLGQGDYFQIMQCYGDAATGPSPENCEYGSAGKLNLGNENGAIATRSGQRCPATTVPIGCDPLEVGTTHHVPTATTFAQYTVPFVPVGTTTQVWGTDDTNSLTDYFDQYTSNEVQLARTDGNGTGQDFFQVLTGTQAPAMGCGVVDPTTGKPRDCWLVLVPRGDYKPNGYQLDSSISNSGFISDSPLGASNWAQRIQVHLGFAPIQQSCPIGSAKERETVGTQIVADAVFSWQLALNQQANCTKLYGYTKTPEATSTSQLAVGSAGGAGMAFTTIPIGSEAGRESGTSTPSPVPVVYAPVAVSALALGFQVNLEAGYKSTPVKLTPRLVAKALTQSYTLELPGFTPDFPVDGPLPDWATNNPTTILHDPEFRALNPDVPVASSGLTPLAPLVTEDHSSLNEQLWEWILSDPSARAWLDGAPDENGMVVNPAYSALKLGDAAIDSFPRADSTCHDTGRGTAAHPSVRCSLDLIPYVADFEDAAVHVRSQNNPEGAVWDPTKVAPDGQSGWWSSGSIEQSGDTFLWGYAGSSDSATYGLVPAELCSPDGSDCVGPGDASVASALTSATADSSGLLHVNPAVVPVGAYPLVDVTYAAVRSDDDPAAISDYADFITYAAGPGQTAGEAPGDLPRGYLPLTDALKAQATAAVATLRAGPNASPSSSPSAESTTQNSDSTSFDGVSSGGGGIGDSNVDATSANQTATGPAPVVSSSVGPAAVIKPTSKPTVYTTPGQPVSAARYATLGVVLAGVAGLVGSPLTRYVGRRRAGGIR